MRKLTFAVAAVAALGVAALFAESASAAPFVYGGVPYRYNYGTYVTPYGGYRSFSNYSTPFGYQSYYRYNTPVVPYRNVYTGPYHSINVNPTGAFYGPGYSNSFYGNPYYGW